MITPTRKKISSAKHTGFEDIVLNNDIVSLPILADFFFVSQVMLPDNFQIREISGKKTLIQLYTGNRKGLMNLSLKRKSIRINIFKVYSIDKKLR